MIRDLSWANSSAVPILEQRSLKKLINSISTELTFFARTFSLPMEDVDALICDNHDFSIHEFYVV